MKSRSADEKRAVVRRFAENGRTMLADGRMRLVIEQTYTLSEAAQAHRSTEAGGGFGTVAPTIDDFRLGAET